MNLLKKTIQRVTELEKESIANCSYDGVAVSKRKIYFNHQIASGIKYELPNILGKPDGCIKLDFELNLTSNSIVPIKINLFSFDFKVSSFDCSLAVGTNKICFSNCYSLINSINTTKISFEYVNNPAISLLSIDAVVVGEKADFDCTNYEPCISFASDDYDNRYFYGYSANGVARCKIFSELQTSINKESLDVVANAIKIEVVPILNNAITTSFAILKLSSSGVLKADIEQLQTENFGLNEIEIDSSVSDFAVTSDSSGASVYVLYKKNGKLKLYIFLYDGTYELIDLMLTENFKYISMARNDNDVYGFATLASGLTYMFNFGDTPYSVQKIGYTKNITARANGTQLVAYYIDKNDDLIKLVIDRSASIHTYTKYIQNFFAYKVEPLTNNQLYLCDRDGNIMLKSIT